MAGLIDNVANLNKRVLALEAKDQDDAIGVAGIQKIYGNIKITCVVSTRLRTNLTPNASLYPSTDLYDEIYPV